MTKRLLFAFLFFPILLAAENQNHLDRYIREGLKNNLALQQQEFSLEKSLQALQEAKGMFYPSVSVLARYSRAGGGRMIYFPAGDMLNPIYRSLNDLYRFHDIDTSFPTNIPNQQIPFLREQEQETKIRVIQPIYQRSIFQNIKLKSALSRVQMAQLNAFKRQLVSDIQSAYYGYAKALSIDRLLEQTRELLEENLRVSEKLVENGKITEDAVYRAQAELAGLDLKKSEAEKNKALATAYFNFLLNRDLENPILMDETPPLPPLDEIEIDKAVGRALKYRHEFQQLQHALSASIHQIALAKSGTLPSLFAVVDYGIQGERYSLDRDDDYWMASLILEWNLFNGNQNQAKKIQAILDQKKLEVQKQELEKQIRIQVHEAYLSYRAAGAGVKAAEKREESSEKSYAIVAKMYANGMAPQIALLDARNTFTSASINRIMAFYDFYLEKARFEQVTALFDLSFYQGEQGDNDDQ
jgi:outer membrane protein